MSLATPLFVPSYTHIILQDGSAERRIDTYRELFDEGVLEFLTDKDFDAGMRGDVPASRSKFKQASADDLKRLIAKNENPNSKHTTSTWFKRYEKWATERGKELTLEV